MNKAELGRLLCSNYGTMKFIYLLVMKP